MSEVQPLLMTVNIMHVGEGGNAGHGKYYYCCVPKIVNVTETNTPIEFRLSDDSKKRFELNQVFCSDQFSQVTPPELGLGGDSLTVIHENKTQCLTFFSLVVTDKNDRSGAGSKINCDPQATNVPPG